MTCFTSAKLLSDSHLCSQVLFGPICPPVSRSFFVDIEYRFSLCCSGVCPMRTESDSSFSSIATYLSSARFAFEFGNALVSASITQGLIVSCIVIALYLSQRKMGA